MKASFTAVKRPFPGSPAFVSKVLARGCQLHDGFVGVGSKMEYQRSVLIFLPAEPTKICSVLFHGMGNDALFGWEDLILQLLDTKRAVLCFDLDGHGALSTTKLDEQEFWRCADFIPELISTCLASVSRLEAIGYSLGALLAARLACEGVLVWQRLVLLAVPESMDFSFRFAANELLSVLSQNFWQQLGSYGWRARIPAVSGFRRRAFPIRLQDKDFRPYPSFVQRRLEEWPLLEKIHQLPLPTLLVFGSRDCLARLDFGRRLVQQLPKGHLEEIAGANHFLLPSDPKVHGCIVKWLLSADNSL